MSPLRGALPTLALALACASQPIHPGRPADPLEARVATVVEKSLFVIPMVDERGSTVRAFLEGGFRALLVRDPALRVAVLEPGIRVSSGGGAPISVALPYGWEAGVERLRVGISLSAARAVGEARRQSPALVALPEGAIEEIFLRGALGRIDPEGRVFRGRDLPAPPIRPPGTVGLLLRSAPDGAEVGEVVAGSPADEAGIERGELVTRIEGQSTAGKPIEEAQARLQGDLGSQVRLELRGPRGTRAVELPRRRVVPLLARPERLEGGLVWLRPHGMAGGLGRAFLHALRGAPGSPAAGALVDLRGNPGGPPAVVGEVAALFVERGRLYAVAGRDPAVAEKAGGETPLAGLPLVVLVDEATAGSAELLAASLQDHRRAAVVGSRTAGRGVIQVTHELGPSPDDLQLLVTVGRLARPAGPRLQGAGVQPDLCTAQHLPAGAGGADLASTLALPRVDCPRRRLEPPAGAPDRELQLGAALLRSPERLREALHRPQPRERP